MGSIYKCSKCGVVTADAGHLCSAEPLEGKYDYCGQDVQNSSTEMCDSMRNSLRFECATCGRPAETPDMVCRPTKVHG